MDTKKNAKNVLLVLGLIALCLIGLYLVVDGTTTEPVKYSDVISYFKNQQVEDFTLDFTDGKLLMKLNDSVATGEDLPNGVQRLPDGKLELSYTVANANYFREDIKDYLDIYNRTHPDAQMTFEYTPTKSNWLLSMLPYVLLIAAMFAFYWFMMRRLGSAMGDSTKQMSFGKARVKKLSDEKRKTTFADVAGADEEKEELREIVGFLKNQKRYQELGARIPKGFLLVGPPGTGKTLLARAVAGEAGANFYSISGSDFVEMFVGVGASRVRDLFEQARRNVPCIIFIDEIDAVGRQRGAGLGGGHDEREQTLNQLLVEMDGFGTSEGVVMIAATNRPDILDPAILRPGRFDRQIYVGYPDVKGREEILKVHARGKPIAPDVSLRNIAKATVGFTGADLENLLNESALLAARREKLAITQDEVEEATIKVMVGTEKKSHVITPEDKRITAYHEAGHAVTTYFCPTQDPVHQVSVIPRGMAAGYTMHIPDTDVKHVFKKKMYEQLVVLLGGRAAEAIVLDDITTGASNDIERATETARSMVTKYGMSDSLGPVLYGNKNEEVFLGRDMGHSRNYSEEVAARIDQEVHTIVSNAYARAQEILREHMNKLHEVTDYLIENEKLDGKTFAQLMEN